MTKHPWLRRLMVAGAICIGLVVALVLVLLVFQPTLNLSHLGHLLEERLTDLAGVPVTLQQMHLKTSLDPTVAVRGLRMARPGPDGVEDLARVETTQLQIELIPLLMRRISVTSLELDQVTMQARPMLGLLQDLSTKKDTSGSSYQLDAFENLDFQRVQLLFTDAAGDAHRLMIDELDGGVSRSSSLQLKVRGGFDDVPLQLEATGPTLEELFTPA
ncbi:MAG: hypothetical protein WBP34_13535, partial [Thermoanaerobaculia bacterium]